jgi:hypothetical protein
VDEPVEAGYPDSAICSTLAVCDENAHILMEKIVSVRREDNMLTT